MANKMSFAQFEGYMVSKYPDCKVWVKDNKVIVDFNKNNPYSKWYEYSKNSYVAILQKLGFPMLYEYQVKTIKAEIERMTEEIKKGGYEDLFGFGEGGFEEFTDEELARINHELEHQKSRLNVRNLIII